MEEGWGWVGGPAKIFVSTQATPVDSRFSDQQA